MTDTTIRPHQIQVIDRQTSLALTGVHRGFSRRFPQPATVAEMYQTVHAAWTKLAKDITADNHIDTDRHAARYASPHTKFHKHQIPRLIAAVTAVVLLAAGCDHDTATGSEATDTTTTAPAGSLAGDTTPAITVDSILDAHADCAIAVFGELIDGSIEIEASNAADRACDAAAAASYGIAATPYDIDPQDPVLWKFNNCAVNAEYYADNLDNPDAAECRRIAVRQLETGVDIDGTLQSAIGCTLIHHEKATSEYVDRKCAQPAIDSLAGVVTPDEATGIVWDLIACGITVDRAGTAYVYSDDPGHLNADACVQAATSALDPDRT